MVTALRFIRHCCTGLLGVGVVIFTIWITEIYEVPNLNELHSVRMHNFSWYILTPLLIGIFFLEAVEIWIKKREGEV